MAVYELQISGTERRAKLSSFRAELVLNGHDNIIAFILPTDGSPEVRFELDDAVELLKDSVSIAAGGVTNVGEEMEPEGGPNNDGRFLSRITVSGWGEIASRRHVDVSVAGGSPGTSLTTVLQQLIAMTDGLGDDGVTLHPSQDTGPIVSAMAFEDTLPSEVLNTLARDTGRVWRIDEQKRLRMWAKGDNAAAFDIDEDDLPALYFGDIRPSRARFEGYANRVIVKGTAQTILDYGETFLSTGVETVFTPVDAQILGARGAIKITNVPSLGIPPDSALWEAVMPPDLDVTPWEYDGISNTFTRLSGPLPSGAIIRITYDASVTPRGVSNDLADQALYPVRDEIVYAPVTTTADAQTLADQILPYLVAAKETKASYSSRQTDLILPGDAQTMTVPSRGLSGSFLVERNVLRSGPGEMNSYLVQDIETTQNQILAGDWRDLLNQFVVGPSGSTVRNGGGDSDGDFTTNPDGDGSASNLSIPPDDTDILINKHGALGTVRTYRGHAQIRYEDEAAVIAGGSPDEIARMSMILTTLSNAPTDYLQKWQSTSGGSPDTPDGVVTMTPFESAFPGELCYGAEQVDGVYIARSIAVMFLILDLTVDTPTGTLALYPDQTPGDPMDLGVGSLQLSIRPDPNLDWLGGLGAFGNSDSSTRPSLWQVDALGMRDQLGTGSSFGLAVLVDDTFTDHRQLKIKMGDATRTIRFDGVGTPVTFT